MHFDTPREKIRPPLARRVTDGKIGPCDGDPEGLKREREKGSAPYPRLPPQL